MANIILSITIVVFVLCLSADGHWKVPDTTNIHNDALSSSLGSFLKSDGVGVCKSMVEKVGYSCEEHTVTTTDGYILSMQRIPAGKSGKKAFKPPVLLRHGIFADAASWLMNPPDQSLGFILADNGYDVWLVSTRGTRYSLGHKSLTPIDPAYWNWSWDELAMYDLTASIKYVHDQTSQNLHYVGHSLGTLMALAAFCEEHPMSMLRSAALLSPISYLDQIPSVLGKAAAYSMLANVLYWSGIPVFNLEGAPIVAFLNALCIAATMDCSSLMFEFVGPSCCVSPVSLNVLFDHGPQPTATKNILHLSQMVREGTIAKFDYGSEERNNEHYGQPTPPLYNMSSIPNNFPLFLAHGGNDYLSDPIDVKKLMSDLKDHDADKLVELYTEEYAHLDYILARNAKQVVYDPIMAFFNRNC